MAALACGAAIAVPLNAASRALHGRRGGGATRAAAAAARLQPGSGLRGLQVQARPGRLARAQAGAIGAGSVSDSSSGSGADSSAQQRRTRGRPASPVPDVDAEQLLQSFGLSGSASATALLRNLRKLNGERQSGVLQHAAAVVQHLCSPGVGLTQQQVGQLLEGCPLLFSREPEQRAAPLFGELMAAGLSAGEAAQCFRKHPSGTNCRSLAAGLSELAAILSHSQDKQSGSGPKPKVPAAKRTVLALLQRIPSAVVLTSQSPGYLQQRSEELQQAGFSAAQVAALAWCRPELLARISTAKLQRTTAVLAEQLGLSTTDVADLVASRKPGWLGSSIDTLRARCVALAEGFGKARAGTVVQLAPEVLGCPPELWQRNLHCMAACGVADPKAALASTPQLLHVDHAAPNFVQRRLLLQRCFGLTAAQLYEGPARCLLNSTPAALAQRLQFIEHCRQQHRLAAKAARGGAAAGLAPHERLLGMTTLCKANQPAFLAAVGASEAEWAAFQQQHPPAQCVLYRWAQQAAEQEAERLRASLPLELRQVQRRRYKGK